MIGGGGVGERPSTPHPIIPSRFLVPGDSVLWRHIRATFGNPVPELLVWVRLKAIPLFYQVVSFVRFCESPQYHGEALSRPPSGL